MMRSLLVRGLLAGLVAGVPATVFAYAFGEPSVDLAIGFEESGSHEHGGELVSRGVQSTLGLFVGVGVYAIAVGGLLALVFAFAHGRVGGLRPRHTALLVTAVSFAVVVLVPFLKYPANPPAVGQEDTIQSRTELYFTFVALSIVVGSVAVVLGRALADRRGAWAGAIAACAGYAVLVGLFAWLLPVVDEVPADFPATTLWNFRVSSLGTQLVLWTVFALVFGTLADRALTGSAARRAHRTA